MSRTFGMLVDAARERSWLRRSFVAVVLAGVACVAAPQLALADTAETVIDGGGSHGCAVKTNGTPVCWGNNSEGQSTLPAGIGTVRSITTGAEHSCAVKTDGTPVCWGSNSELQATVPTDIGTVRSISAGYYHTCAIETDATVVCWGSNRAGQLNLPSDLGTVIAISSGNLHSCAIKTGGTPVCWGIDWEGRATPPVGTGTVISISAGGAFSCAVKTDGSAVCFGGNWSGQINVPGDVGTLTSITTGDSQTCAIRTDGTPVCWGNNSNGQSSPPSTIGTVSSIATGFYFSCAVKTDGGPVCWGTHDNGASTLPSDIGTVGPLAPRGTTAPSVSGTLEPGHILTADAGTWANDPTGYAYSWERCSGLPIVCTTISGSLDADDADSTYTLTDDDLGVSLRVLVTASNAVGSNSDVSPRTARVGRPVSTVRPAVTGSTQIGAILTAEHGTWTNSPTGYAYLWQSCSGTPAVCSAITGATDAPTYTITADDYATRLRVVVTATNTVGTGATYSLMTATIGSKPVATSRPVITGTRQVGELLSADDGTWNNDPTGYSYRWQRCAGTPSVCTTITGATDPNYTITTDDYLTRLRIIVLAANPVGSTSNISVTTAIGSKPVSTTRPAITGNAEVGVTLSTDDGTWDNDPTGYSYRWQRCSGTPSVCTTITGATDPTYTITGDDLANRLRVDVIATNPLGSTARTSLTTLAITDATCDC